MNDKVAIVGSGLVGRAWAISFARGGHDVVLFDADNKAVANALRTVEGLVPRQPLTTIPKYDEMVTQRGKLSSNNTRPETNVVRAIGAHELEPWSFEPPSSVGTSKSSSPGSGGAGG